MSKDTSITKQQEERTIPLQQLRIYHWLQSERILHTFFWAGIFIIVFSFFAIHAWYQNVEHGVIVEPPEFLAFLKNLGALPRFQQFAHIFIESMIYTGVIAIPVYINYFLVYKRNYLHRLIEHRLRKGEQEGWALYLFILGSGILAFLFAFPLHYFFHEYLEIIESRHWSHTFVVILLLTIITAALTNNKDEIERIRDYERLERLNAIEERKRAEEKLIFLKKQIRPHFLFNTLQNLQILAKKKSDDLPQLMLQLSTMLRYLIYHTDEEKVALVKELEFIESYIDLKSYQKNPLTEVTFLKEGEFAEHFMIAPMVLLNIVENCFKHSSPNTEGVEYIKIHLRVKGNYLDLFTENSHQENVANEAYMKEFKEVGGVGLKSTKEILRMVYIDNYHWKQYSENNVFYSHLRLPVL